MSYDDVIDTRNSEQDSAEEFWESGSGWLRPRSEAALNKENQAQRKRQENQTKDPKCPENLPMIAPRLNGGIHTRCLQHIFRPASSVVFQTHHTPCSPLWSRF